MHTHSGNGNSECKAELKVQGYKFLITFSCWVTPHLWITEKQVLVGVVPEQKVIVVDCRPAKNYLKDVLVVFEHPLLNRAREA